MLEIAMALRLKGIAGGDAIAEMTGRETDEVEGVLQTMVEAGHAQETPRGLRLLPEGKEWVDSLLDEEREGVDQTLMNTIYEDFCLHNDTFKQLVTDWQIKVIDGEQVMNEHEDADYEAAIITRLDELDGVVLAVIVYAAEVAP
ncbi:MAG: MarR family transcriptional regulator, partial [Actinomycetota bacterium]|nr:MarR family transcriptional regulator [Actinomycetota bacterium]